MSFHTLTCHLHCGPDRERVLVTFNPEDDDAQFLVQWADDLAEVPCHVLDTHNRELILFAVGAWLVEHQKMDVPAASLEKLYAS